ncbi:hypothetical protein HOY82DRAFT_538597 [Tuber indicum]|nr:hypothetical protein HOY82DRAFT_538597 [Tuber indicum]
MGAFFLLFFVCLGGGGFALFLWLFLDDNSGFMSSIRCSVFVYVTVSHSRMFYALSDSEWNMSLIFKLSTPDMALGWCQVLKYKSGVARPVAWSCDTTGGIGLSPIPQSRYPYARSETAVFAAAHDLLQVNCQLIIPGPQSPRFKCSSDSASQLRLIALQTNHLNAPENKIGVLAANLTFPDRLKDTRRQYSLKCGLIDRVS